MSPLTKFWFPGLLSLPPSFGKGDKNLEPEIELTFFNPATTLQHFVFATSRQRRDKISKCFCVCLQKMPTGADAKEIFTWFQKQFRCRRPIFFWNHVKISLDPVPVGLLSLSPSFVPPRWTFFFGLT